jgi:hypothetical protein
MTHPHPSCFKRFVANSAGNTLSHERVFYTVRDWKILISFNKKSMSDKDNAGTQTVETKGNEVINNGGQSASSGQKDPEQLLQEANARIAKLAEERDNYKRGMLMAKGKLDKDDDDNQQPDIREIAREEARAMLAETDFGKAVQERDELITRIAKENKELKLAIGNRPGTGTSQGGNQESEKPKDNTLSEAQERDLRARGWDDKKIEHFKKLSSR